MFWLCFSVAVIMIHLIYLAKNSVNIGAFFQLPFVRVMLVGSIIITCVYYYANVIDYKSYYKPEVENPYKYPSYNVYTNDSLFYDPKTFVTYITGLKNVIREDTLGEVSHYILLQEWKENLNYWTLVCENRMLISDVKDFNYARLYLAHIYYMDFKYADAKRIINETTIALPSKNNLKGKIYKAIQQWDSATVFFKNDLIETHNRAQLDEIYVNLLSVYRVQGDYCGVLDCGIHSEVANKMISIAEWDRSILFCEGPLNYFAHSLDGYVNSIDWFNWVLALVVSVLWIGFFLLLDLFEKKNLFVLLLIILAEFVCLFFLMDVWLDFKPYFFPKLQENTFWQDFFLTVAIPEETIKIIPVLLIWALFRKKLYEPYDVLMLGIVSACVFALVENSIYFNIYSGRILLSRTLFACLTHIVCTSLIVYGFILYHFNRKKYAILQLLGFVLLSWMTHAAYDFFFVINWEFFSLLIYLFAMTMLAIIINNCLNSSPKFTYLIHLPSLHLTEVLGFSISLLIGVEYILSYLEKGTNYANFQFFETFGRNALFLFFVVTKLSSYDLVRGFWKRFRLFQFDEDPQTATKTYNLFMWIVKLLVNNSNYPQNFVGLNVSMKPHSNNKFQSHLPDFFTGKFIGRAVVEYQSNGKKMVSEKWFYIQLNYPMSFNGVYHQIVLMRFRNYIIPLEYINGQTVYVYQVTSPDQLAAAVVQLEEFNYMGASVIKLV